MQASTLTKALQFHKTLAESPPSSWKTLDPKDYALAPNLPSEFHLYQSQTHVDRLIFRVAARVSSAAELLDWYTALNSVSLRRKWDQHIADVELISSPAPNTHIVKHLYKIGWVTSVRELNLISTTLSDQSSVLHVAASLPADLDHRLSITSSAASASLISWSVHKIIADEADASTELNTYDLNVFWSWDLKYWSAGLGHLEPPVYIPKLITNLLAFFPVFANSSPLVTDFGESIDLRAAQAYDQVNSANAVFTCEYRVNLSSHRDALLRDVTTKVKSDIGISLSTNPTRQGRVIIFLGPANTAWSIDLHVEREGSGVLGWKAAVEDNARHAFLQLKIDHDIPKSAKDYLTVSVRITRKDQGKDILVNGRKVKIQAEDDPSSEKRRGEYLKPLLPLAINSTQLDATAFAERSIIDTSSRQLVQERVQAAYKSMLQYHNTPSAQWKEMQPFRGVTLAQLPIQGKPLGVLKRQTISDASLWDTAAAIIHAQTQWDDAWVERLTILDRLNEQCSLLYLKTKGTWPISSRDMILAQTMTSTSKAIYIYSVSIDDVPLSTDLEVPAASKVLRAKVDLFGWVIDSATAKQCRVSQYTLADWKGWGSTSSLYQPFWNSIANVVNYSASCGGPPILTQLTNANLSGILFEHDKSVMRVEYRTDFANESRNHDEDNAASPVTQSTAEFRINTVTWSRDAEMLINPHPFGIRCTRKPRDNGIWVTIQHTDVAMGSGKVAVVIRRGAEHTGKDTVIINGTKYAAENAAITAAESPSKKNPAAAGISKIDGLAFKTASSEHLDTASVLSVAAQTRNLDPYSANDSSAHSQSSTLSASSKRMRPMDIAFQALEAVNTLHRADDTGWTSLAARKGIKMAKKVDTAVSPTIPVLRGEMVMEGFDVDEILSVITSFSARKEWDDTFDDGQVLQSYGSGCSTSLLTFKSPLAFLQVKGREIQIASVAARFVQDATAAPSSPTVPNALYVAGASFTRNTTIQSLNILTNVLLDGWILESIDPYTMTTNYAIPSTRVTRIECVDYGSLTYLQSMVTSTVPKVLLGISSYLKNHGPTPYTAQPSAYIQVVEGLQSPQNAIVDYEIDELDQAKDLLDSVFSQERSTYRACVQLDVEDTVAASRLRAWKLSIQNLDKSGSRNGLPDTPSGTRSRLISTTSRPQSIVDSPLNRSTANVVPASPARQERRASISSLSSRKSQKSIISAQALDYPDDFVVLDLLLDAKRYPKGFAIATYAYSPQKSDLPLVLPASLDLEDLPAPLHVPLATDIYEIAAPPSYAASLNGSALKPFKYLVRMTLPAIIDLDSKATLTSLDRGWWQSLIAGKCVIDIRISPNEGDRAILVDGEAVSVSQELPSSFHHNALVSGQVDDDAADTKLPSALRLRRTTRSDFEARGDRMHIPDVYDIPRAVSASVARDLNLANEVSLSLATPTSATFNQRSVSGRSASTIAGTNHSASDFDDAATEIAGSGGGPAVANHRQKQGENPSTKLFDMASEGASQLTAAVHAAVDRKSSVPIIVAILVAMVSIYVGMKISNSVFAKPPIPIVYVGAGHVQKVNDAVGEVMQVKALRYTLKLFGWDIVIARAA